MKEKPSSVVSETWALPSCRKLFLSAPQEDPWLFSVFLGFGFLSALRRLCLFNLSSSIYDFLTHVSASILPIFVGLYLKNYWVFQWNNGFAGVSGESESDKCV